MEILQVRVKLRKFPDLRHIDWNLLNFLSHCRGQWQAIRRGPEARSGGSGSPSPTGTRFHRKWFWINKNTRRPYLNGVAVWDSFWCENKWKSLIYCPTYLCINQTETLPSNKFVFIEKWLRKQKWRKLNFGLCFQTLCLQNKYLQSFLHWSFYFLKGFLTFIWETNKGKVFLI